MLFAKYFLGSILKIAAKKVADEPNNNEECDRVLYTGLLKFKSVLWEILRPFFIGRLKIKLFQYEELVVMQRKSKNKKILS
jgi:hypothetical protein